MKRYFLSQKTCSKVLVFLLIILVSSPSTEVIHHSLMVTSKDSSQVSDSSVYGTETIIAQYLVTKVAWWATYPRLLLVTCSTLSTYNPETFQCTDQWEIADIEAVELSSTKNQFVLRLEKSRFRSTKLKLVCSAQGHLLSLLARLRRQAQGNALLYPLGGACRPHFRCIEQFADASGQLLFLQVTVASIIFTDECGHHVQIVPFLHLRKVAFSTGNEDGMVFSTAFHDRFFLCGERHKCLNNIIATAHDVGVELHKTSSEITALQLRLHNTQVLDRPTLVRFDVKKVILNEPSADPASKSEDSDAAKKALNEMQLSLQGDALVEIHCAMRTVIARPYNALLAIVRPDRDPRTLVLEFKQEDTLILDVDGRDQLITLLLLACREAGHHNVVLTSSGLNYCRFYHPHAADSLASNDSNVASASMGTFLLRRITQTSARPDDCNGRRSRSSSIWSPRRRRGGSTTPRASQGNNDPAESDANGRGSWFQRRMNKGNCIAEPSYEARKSMDSGVSMNDNINIVIAMEELNANLPLDELSLSGPGQEEVVNKAMELVFEHLVTLIASLRRYGDTTTSELLTTLQALVRLYHHPDACFTREMIPHVYDAVHELILQQDGLICYWCLKLLQCFLGVRAPNTSPHSNAAGDQRANAIQHFVHHKTLQHAILDLIPTSFAASDSSSFRMNSSAIGNAFWTAGHEARSSASSSPSSTQSSVLCTKEARVQNEINVVFYETLLTLHHLLGHIQSAAKLQHTARVRQNYMAAGNQAKHQKHGLDDLPAVKQMDALATKLLEKYRFLIDSIVDIRLVRMAETSMALVKFVLNHFVAKAPDSPLQPSDSPLSCASGGGVYDSRNKWLGALGSFFHDYQVFAESSMETQSLHFGSERSIELPILSSETSDAMEKLLNPGTTNRLSDIKSNGSMRLEYLDPSEPSSSSHGEDATTKPSKQKPDKETPTTLEQPRIKPNANKACARLARRNNQALLRIDATSPTRLVCDNVRKMNLGSDDEGDTVGLLQCSDQAPTAAQADPRPFQVTLGSRRTANTCDACIGCNDVCTNDRCFFCAEKEYQLKIAFGDAAEAVGPTVRQATWQHRAPPSTDSPLNVDRDYSSCEMKRHQSIRSCWIRVGDSIYDVTDLLGVHPGGAHVLLEAAQHGGDCGPILKTHPPVARKMLVQYRLGRYYECKNS